MCSREKPGDLLRPAKSSTTELTEKKYDIGGPFRSDYRARTTGLVASCAWIGQNMRFLLLALTAIPGWPAGFFWLTLGPLNLVLLGLVLGQERAARAMLHVVAAPAEARARTA